MKENYIELADGTQFSGMAAITNDVLLITTDKQNAQEHFLDFGDPNKMSKVTFAVNPRHKTEFEGYSKFSFLEIRQAPEKVLIWMRKPD